MKQTKKRKPQTQLMNEKVRKGKKMFETIKVNLKQIFLFNFRVSLNCVRDDEARQKKWIYKKERKKIFLWVKHFKKMKSRLVLNKKKFN